MTRKNYILLKTLIVLWIGLLSGGSALAQDTIYNPSGLTVIATGTHLGLYFPDAPEGSIIRWTSSNDTVAYIPDSAYGRIIAVDTGKVYIMASVTKPNNDILRDTLHLEIIKGEHDTLCHALGDTVEYINVKIQDGHIGGRGQYKDDKLDGGKLLELDYTPGQGILNKLVVVWTRPGLGRVVLLNKKDLLWYDIGLHVLVSDKPVILSVSDTFELKCNTTSLPFPVVDYKHTLVTKEGWIRGNDTITMDSPQNLSQLKEGDTLYYFIESICGNAISEKTMVIHYKGRPQVTATNNGPACVGGNINLSVEVQDAVAPITYSWTGPNNFTSTLQNPVLINVGTNISDSIYKVKITDGNGCTVPAETVVKVNEYPVVTINPLENPVCVGTGIQMTGNITNAWDTTYWSSEDVYIANIADTGYLDGVSAGTVDIYYSAAKGDCWATDTLEVEIINCATNIVGTVFPFVNIDGKNDFNKEFPIIVKLKKLPGIPATIADLENAEVLDTTIALYYDGTKLIGNTPKFPGYIGGTSNKGDTIIWENTIKRHDYLLKNDTLQGTEKPAQAIGYFQFTKIIRPGTYVLEIKREGFITRWAKVTIVKDENHLGHREMIFGDFNDDFKITEADASAVWSNRKQYVSTNPYDFDFELDIDGNSAINSLDYRQVLLKIGANIRNYNDTEKLFKELRITLP